MPIGFPKLPALHLVALMALVGCTSHEARPQVHVSVRIEVPGDTPDSARVYLAGSLPVLGSWQPDGFPLEPLGEGLWQGTFPCRSGERVEFKVTLGSWATEAIYVQSVVPQNTTLEVLRDTTVRLQPITWHHLAFASVGGVSGTVHYYRDLGGEGLRYPHDVMVWLPPSYASAAEKRYPVLYMHDAQNIMDPGTSFLGIDWRVDEVADSLIKLGRIDEIIVVGCTNSPDRAAEYSDTKLGRAYARFMVERVKPMIDSLYRTLPDRAHTAVMGSSMGGLISFLFVWWYPEVYSMAGCLSSAFAYAGDELFDEVTSTQLPQGIRLYLDCGTEDLDARLLEGSERMVELLRAKGMVEGSEVLWFVDHGATHNEGAWAERIWRPLEFFFGARR